MKVSVLHNFLTSILLVLVAACSVDQGPPPQLTYVGENPRVQNPLSPEDSQKHIQLPEGFTAKLYAAEPDIINPIAFTWDERGRLWVVQSMDYPHELENEVGGDRITICEDTDGDGRADSFIDFATEQSLTTGIVLVAGGAIVAQAPEMVYLQDTDGDDKFDERTVLFDGFGIWDTHAGPSGLRYGPDNMIWGAVGYSGFENTFDGERIDFKMGVFRFSRDGRFFQPWGQFNNNTWGLGINEEFEIFGSTANNNHCCYVGIPLKHYEYLNRLPSWAVNADFIQGHYEISPVDTIPLQQVDVRGGYTAASGANFYTARNYPQQYWNQMYVNEPTGHLVHIARIEDDGAGYKEVDGGNIFASTDAWTAPVFTETGPDGNLWVADWYNPVIQHNPDKRGMDNQIWNADKGPGNAHLNPRRDKQHGRIYIIEHEDADKPDIRALDPGNSDELIKGLKSDNMFWRITAQRLIVEGNKQELIPELVDMINDDKTDHGTAAVHALWSLDGLEALNESNLELVEQALASNSNALKRAGLSLLPASERGSNLLAGSGLLTDQNLHIRLAAILRASELPETDALYQKMQVVINDPLSTQDKWLNAAVKVYHRESNQQFADPSMVSMVVSTDEEKKSQWNYTVTEPGDNWYALDYDQSDWSSGVAPFGSDIQEKAKTSWTTSDIWMRKTATMKQLLNEPVLKIMHDDDYSVYVNGQLLISEQGVSKEYKYLILDPESSQLFTKGKNLIAVHCHNNGGNQYIDAGIGVLSKPKADRVFEINTVDQKMAYDKTLLRAQAGQTIEIVLRNKDQMPHNLVVLQAGSLPTFGEMVDSFLKTSEAAEMDYVPRSKYVIGSTKMLDPGEVGSIIFKLPEIPGRYPFVCTFPGHWRLMQGVIIVEAPGSFLSTNPESENLALMGGGGSHDFLNHFAKIDGRILSNNGELSVLYTEQSQQLGSWLPDTDVLYLCNNKPFDAATKKLILNRAQEGMGILIYHPSTWYNWKDWPEYNKMLVGGGSQSHEKLQEFEVQVTNPDHPIMENVPEKFRIVDELYRWEQDPDAVDIEVLAIGKGIESGEEYPVVWIAKHPNSRIVCNTLGHDERAHNLKAYQTILGNSLQWIREKPQL